MLCLLLENQLAVLQLLPQKSVCDLTLVLICCLTEHVYSWTAARHPVDQLVHLVCPLRWIPCAMLSVRRQDTMMLLGGTRCTVHMA